MSQNPFKDFEDLIAVYLQAKGLIIYAEEFDPGSNSNLQINKECKDALDHLIYALHAKVEGDPGLDGGDATSQIDSSIKHINRASFDALDGTVLSLKDRIHQELVPYDSDLITSVLPDYWNIKGKLNNLVKSIAKHRENKGSITNTPEALDRYMADVNSLKENYDKIIENGPNFSDRHKELRKKHVCGIVEKLIIAIIAGLIGIFIGAISASILGDANGETDVPTIQMDLPSDTSP